MSIVGKKVYHTSLFGSTDVEGIIQGVNPDETIIDISFKNDSQPIRQFLVPRAFEAHDGVPANLITHDQEILAWIESLYEHTCSLCHCRTHKLSKFGEYLVCENCKNKFRRCSNCGRYIYPDEMKYDYRTDKLLCNDCYTATHKRCSVCNREFPNYYFVQSDYLLDDKPVCINCVDDTLIQCSDCHKYFPESQIKYISGVSYCHDCYNQPKHICVNCGSRTVNSLDGLCGPCYSKNVYYETFLASEYFDKKIFPIDGSYASLKNTRTRNLMSALRGDPHPHTYQILLLCDYLIKAEYHYDLVIVPDFPLNCSQSTYLCNMTAFKSECYFQKRKKISECLEDKDCIYKDYDHKIEFVLIPEAFELRAQTYSDMDYGFNRHQYGDTSSFYIIGAMMHKNVTVKSSPGLKGAL